MLEIVKPSLKDIPTMQKLIEPEVVSGIILDRSDNEVANAIRSYILAKEGDVIYGYCALHIHTLQIAEIRSLIIVPKYRGQGVGARIVQEALNEALSLGVEEVLTLTYEAEFFKKLGFIEIPKESIPEQKIWLDCIKCKHFPICNEVSLIKKL
ncbi:MAG: N-acetyltransferase [Campylobacterales bacterium]